MPASADITSLLQDLDGDNRDAVDRILPLVYPELREMAQRHLRGERSDLTLDTGALVHEAYLKLVRQDGATWQNRAHFFGIAALAMRRILVDYAKRARAAKRGGGVQSVTFIDGQVPREARTDDLLALDEALERLSGVSDRAARVITLGFFGGLTQPEIAEVLGVSEITVRRDWRMARAWLTSALTDTPLGDAPG